MGWLASGWVGGGCLLGELQNLENVDFPRVFFIFFLIFFHVFIFFIFS